MTEAVAAPAPAPAPALDAVTDAGLVKRVPGQAAGTSRGAEAFDSGQFRRLPVPGAVPEVGGDAETEAARRLESLSRFQRAVGRGRTADADPTGFPERLAPYAAAPANDAPAPAATAPAPPATAPAPPTAPAPTAAAPAPSAAVPTARHAVPPVPQPSARPVIPAATGGPAADNGEVDPFDISWINNEQERGW
jgi:hypothetical protein